MSGVLASSNLTREAIRSDPSLFEGDVPVEQQVERILVGVRVLFGLGLASMLVCIVLDVALLVGNAKSWPRPLLAWVIGYSVVTAGTIGFGLYMTVIMMVTADDSPELWFFIVCQLAAGAIFIYLILVVYSYYRVLREREEGGAYTMQQLAAA